MPGSPSADMQAGQMNPLLLELLRQRQMQQAPMPPAQDPRYSTPPQQPMPPMTPWQGGNIPGVNGFPMPSEPHPLPSGGGIVRGQSMIPHLGSRWTDTPYQEGMRYEPRANWMDVIRRRIESHYPDGYDPWALDRLTKYAKDKYGLDSHDLARLLMQADETRKPYGGTYERNM